jgi:hypothetical protein
MMEQTTEGEEQQTEARMEQLLEENLALNKENNKILRRMERNALISFFAKIFLWLLLLGLPLIFFGPYLKPLFGLLTGAPADGAASPIGVPSESQLQQLLNVYTGK